MLDRYTREEMRILWSDRTRYETWLEVELAVCRAMEKREIVPAGTADKVRLAVTIDPEQIERIEARVRHDVIAFLTHVEEQAGEPARWLHLGLTSSDVLDTSFAMQLRQAGKVVLERLDNLIDALRERAIETKRLAMVGRTHGIHAEPTSVGLFLLGLHCEMSRCRDRLQTAVKGIGFGKIAGTVGNYGNVSPEIERDALGQLDLTPEPCATQVVPRDRHAAFFCALGQVAASVERIAVQVRHWQRTEVGEAYEAFTAGQKGSSAMPHKKNPILSENLCGLARVVRSAADTALQNVALWHERDISHSSVERMIAPDATALLDFMLNRAASVVRGLVFDEARLGKNLELTGGLIYSEAVLLALVRKGMGRQQAYEVVQSRAMAAASGEGDFLELLLADEAVGEHLSNEEVSSCFSVEHHLQHVDTIFERVLGSGDE